MVEKWINILSKFNNSEVISMELRGVWSFAKVEDREVIVIPIMDTEIKKGLTIFVDKKKLERETVLDAILMPLSDDEEILGLMFNPKKDACWLLSAESPSLSSEEKAYFDEWTRRINGLLRLGVLKNPFEFANGGSIFGLVKLEEGEILYVPVVFTEDKIKRLYVFLDDKRLKDGVIEGAFLYSEDEDPVFSLLLACDVRNRILHDIKVRYHRRTN